MESHAFGTDAGAVYISAAEHDLLLETGRKYIALRQALLAGGVTNESLDVLISTNSLSRPDSTTDDTPIETPDYATKSKWGPAPTAQTFIPDAHKTLSNLPRLQTALKQCNPSPPETNCADGEELQDEFMADVEGDGQDGDENIAAHRSLVISGLSRATTLQSVAKALRGGMILEMYLRLQRCTAHVSFVDPSAAEKFLEYSQTNDIYILGKKVTVDWDDQQRWIKPNMANRIVYSGLTCNLVVRFARQDWTASTIRADLEHIHLLEIVDLFFRNGHVYISTNSIQNAMIARTCMLSQFRYKRMKIDSWPDDCAQPLPLLRKRPSQYSMTSQPPSIRGNRFELLQEDTCQSKDSTGQIHFSGY